MKLFSLFESRTENLGVTINPADFKRIMKEGERNFHYKCLEDNNFVISLNLSFGSDLLFDMTHPNTKSDIIFYGEVNEIEGSRTKVSLRSRSKDLPAILLIIMPLIVLCFQMILKLEPVTFFIPLIFFPLVIIGLMNLIRGEEDKLLRLFKEYLNNQIIKHCSHT